jgi:DNA-directed DNA polymerase III PolC
VDELKEMVKENPQFGRLMQLSSRIEGISRHLSVHAAGVVIAPGPLQEYVPICTAPTKGAGAATDGEDSLITQYEMGALEKVGMLKMDMLGLKTLTVIHDAVHMIRDRHGVTVDMDTLPFDDPAVYATLRAGRTAGVFQFESALATETLRAMKCDRFDDLVASNALLRPGPLDAGMHTVFIKRKLGQEKVTYPHPSLKELLEPTYGVITYQEQVMRIANILAGFSLAEADVLRKAVGKKDAELIKKELGRFVERTVALGHPKKLADELAAQIETFGRYGFNKSHSVAYSVLSYQTAWLKTHYPSEFMAALLSSEIGNTDKVVQYINEARELGCEILPPDVNESGFKFTVVADKRIRFGLGAVRNVGEGAIESIIAGRREGRYETLADLVERIDLRLCNKRVVESPHRGRRVRLARRAPQAASRGARDDAAGSAAQAGRPRCGPGVALRRDARHRAPAGGTARRAAMDRERTPRAPRRSDRVLHFGSSAGALPRGGGAVRRAHDRDAAPVERASRHDRRRGDGAEAADLEEDGQGVRAAGAGGFPRHRGGHRLSRRVGQAQPVNPARLGAPPHRRLQRP